MKTRLLILAVFLSSGVFAQNFWSETTTGQKELKQDKKVQPGERVYTADVAAMMQFLQNAPQRQAFSINSSLVMEFPNLNGKMERYYMAEASNFAPGLQAQYPQIRSYRGVSAENPGTSIAISVSPNGVQTIRFATDEPTIFIESITTDNSVYKVMTKSPKSEDWSCTTPHDEMEQELTNRFANPETLDADDQTMRDFRLAISVTGEYTAYFGGTVAGALAGINATMTRVNAVFERDLALRLTVIDNTTDVIYTNASTDPYSNASNMNAWNGQLQQTLTSVIGEANYDIGHLFGGTGGGGNAGCIGCVCVNGSKGSGITSPYNGIPEGDRFDIDYVAHEFGHQLGAYHTFSSFEGAGVNVEPGSGSTIMGYAGITPPETNVQQFSDDYFHTVSIDQITSNVKNKNCPTEIPLANQPPTAEAGPSYAIPVGTPFVLTGSGSDPDNDAITYTWEQVNSNNQSVYTYAVANPNATFGPLFRSMPPTTNPVRYFPSFDKVLAGTLSTPFETVSNVARSTNFRLQVRDNNPEGGQTASDAVLVNVISQGGPFRVTSPESTSTVPTNADFTVTWDVAQTNLLPVNTPNVDILLSVDGGESFTLIAENTANDGSEAVAIPADAMTENAYIMVRAVGNIFYALSPKFYIGYTVSTECTEYTASNLPANIPDGTGGGYGGYAAAQFAIPDIGPVDEISVEVDITHTYVGDLQVVLESPSPISQVVLWNRQCGGSDNIVANFTDSGSAVNCGNITGDIMPSQALSGFQGYTSQGNWYVGVRDGAAQDTGTFNSATITFCTVELAPMGTADVSNDRTFVQVYPNPSNGIFNISMDLQQRGVKLGVYDVSGKLLQSYKDDNASGAFRHQLNLGGVAKGVYILQVQSGNTVTSKKLIVK